MSRLRDKLADAEAEILRLKAALDPTLHHLRLESGELEIALSGPLLQNFALMLAEHCRRVGAHNYMEINLNSTHEHYTVTFQRVKGKTPGELTSEWKRRCELLSVALATAYAQTEGWENIVKSALEVRAPTEGGLPLASEEA